MVSSHIPSLADRYNDSRTTANQLQISSLQRRLQPPSKSEDNMNNYSSSSSVFEAARSLSDLQRYDLVHLLLESLPQSSAMSLLNRFGHGRVLDPIEVLPAELIFQILTLLDTKTVSTLSTVSSAWRRPSLDSFMWRNHAYREGWKISVSFEAQVRNVLKKMNSVNMATSSPPTLILPLGVIDLNVLPFNQLPSRKRTADHKSADDLDEDEDDRMRDVPTSENCPNNPQGNNNSSQITKLITHSNPPRIDWHEVYRQRRRLESNWRTGRFTNFQFPHPRHPEEGHTSYVYSMQYSGSFLVTGSRDQSIRIWNMETQRLVRPPLLGHVASVLCLQFDPSPQDDVLVSSGSDKQIIIWRFSTGAMLRTIPDAHTDYVLNLRFTEKFLVSCSKDHLIKVWCRKTMTASDPDLPQVSNSPNITFSPELLTVHQEYQLQTGHSSTMIPPYGHLMTLHGHNSAVNSVQITGGQIISASGDRQIKMWNLHTGLCVRTISGHSKGVACIEADGRRIVSGSSDNSIRIFDHSTGAEVGLLCSHSDLVRTVQAQFSDLPGVTDLDYERAARVADEKHVASTSGDFYQSESPTRRPRGSRRPEPAMTIGAKLPPGGGGGPWGRIVSGSYDKTVVVWRRDREGNWVVGLTLPYALAAIRARDSGLRRPATSRVLSPEWLGERQFPQAGIPSSIPVVVRMPTTRENIPHLMGLNGQIAAGTRQIIDIGDGQRVIFHRANTHQYRQPPQPQPHQHQHQHHHHQQIQTHTIYTERALHHPGPVQVSDPIRTIPDAGSTARWRVPAPDGTPPHGMAGPSEVGSVSSSFASLVSNTPAPLVSLNGSIEIPVPDRTVVADLRQVHRNQRRRDVHNLPNEVDQPLATSERVETPRHVTNSNDPTMPTFQQWAPPLHHPQHQHPEVPPPPPPPRLPGQTEQLLNGNIVPGTNMTADAVATFAARVFKVQFDRRRIICCSQNPVIVGWDFANGDEKILGAVKFFED